MIRLLKALNSIFKMFYTQNLHNLINKINSFSLIFNKVTNNGMIKEIFA